MRNDIEGAGPAGPEPLPEDNVNNPRLLELLDEASPHAPLIDPRLDEQRRTASDPTRPLEDRLEAYEDITESEVGDTSLSRARNVEREVGLRQIFLKFEGGNPSGSQKDRIAFAQVMDAVRRGFDAITVATCGNFGAAMAVAARFAGLRCIICIPEGYHTKRIKEITDNNAEIKRVPGDYEHAVIESQAFAEKNEFYDANPGGPNTPLQLRAYGEIAYEIYDELRDAPAAVAVPVSNGTTLAGIYRGFVSLHRRGKTSRVPRMIAASSFNKNPIIQAYIKNLPECVDLEPGTVKETVVNEPLINWHSIDGDHALQAVRETDGWASYGSDKSMLLWARKLRSLEGLNALPASTAGLIALLERHAKEPLTPDRYVVVLTGRNS
jgi:threonine synthase